MKKESNVLSHHRRAIDFSTMFIVIVLTSIFSIQTIFAESTTTAQIGQTITSTQLPDTTPPATPMGIYASDITTSSVKLIWQTSIDSEIVNQIKSGLKGYQIFKDNEPNSFMSSLGNYVVVEGLSPGTTHTFSIMAIDNNYNVSQKSNVISVTLLNTTSTSGGSTETVGTTSGGSTALLPDVTPPSVPFTLSALNITNNGFVLTWPASIDAEISGQARSGLKGYKVFKDGASTPVLYSTINSVAITGITPGTTHSFSVSSFDVSGNSSVLSVPFYITIPSTATTETPTATTNTTVVNTSTTTTVTTPTNTVQQMLIEPLNTSVEIGGNIIFKAKSALNKTVLTSVSWSVYELNGGSVNSSGIYLAPNIPGTYHVFTTLKGYSNAVATIVVKDRNNITTNTTQVIKTAAPTVINEQSKVIVPPNPTVAPVNPIKKDIPPVITNPTNSIQDKAPVPEIVESRPNWSQTFASPTTSIAIKQLKDINYSVEVIRNSIEDNKKKLIDVVDKGILESGITLDATSTDAKIVREIRETVLREINSKLVGSEQFSTSTVRDLKSTIADGLEQIKRIKSNPNNEFTTATSSEVVNIFQSLVSTIDTETKTLKDQGGDLLYKDTNKDGISDYESVYLYNIDPVKPAPVTIIGGRTITADEKILLGYDPAQVDLVKVTPEEPSVSVVVATSVYKVNEIKLNPEKKVVINGQALPNSYVTIYIYSTPIIVVVKTNENGDWQYTLDKELDTGDHRIYAASVNNSGKIVAKSSEFTFVKTAEAATLNSLPILQGSVDVKKPGLLGNGSIFMILIIFFVIVIISVGMIGINARNSGEEVEHDSKVD